MRLILKKPTVSWSLTELFFNAINDTTPVTTADTTVKIVLGQNCLKNKKRMLFHTYFVVFTVIFGKKIPLKVDNCIYGFTRHIYTIYIFGFKPKKIHNINPNSYSFRMF